MQLFHNRSQSLVPRTRATIVQLCKDYGISEKEAPNHGPLSDSNYPTYVKSITGYYPCPVCGGPQGRVLTGEARTVEVPTAVGSRYYYKIEVPETWSSVRCLKHPCHTLIAQKHDQCEWEERLGPLCEKHGLYSLECKDCLREKHPHITL